MGDITTPLRMWNTLGTAFQNALGKGGLAPCRFGSSHGRGTGSDCLGSFHRGYLGYEVQFSVPSIANGYSTTGRVSPCLNPLHGAYPPCPAAGGQNAHHIAEPSSKDWVGLWAMLFPFKPVWRTKSPPPKASYKGRHPEKLRCSGIRRNPKQKKRKEWKLFPFFLWK